MLRQLIKRMKAFDASYQAMGWMRVDTAEMTCSVLLQESEVR